MKIRFFDIFVTSLFTVVSVMALLVIWETPPIILCCEQLPSWVTMLGGTLLAGSIGEELLYLQRKKEITTGLLWTNLPGFIQGWLLLLGILWLSVFYRLPATPLVFILTFIPSLLTFSFLVLTVFHPRGKELGFYPFFLHMSVVNYSLIILLYPTLPATQKVFWSWSTFVVILSTLSILAGSIAIIPPMLRVIFHSEKVTAQNFYQWLDRYNKTLLKILGIRSKF